MTPPESAPDPIHARHALSFDVMRHLLDKGLSARTAECTQTGIMHVLTALAEMPPESVMPVLGLVEASDAIKAGTTVPLWWKREEALRA